MGSGDFPQAASYIGYRWLYLENKMFPTRLNSH